MGWGAVATAIATSGLLLSGTVVPEHHSPNPLLADAGPHVFFATPGAIYHVRGPESRGGDIEFFLNSVRLFRQSKVKVVLEGECASSCTLYAALARDGLVCAQPKTKLVFHEFVYASDLVAEGGLLMGYTAIAPVRGRLWNRIWQSYPAKLRHIITTRFPGGRLPPQGQEIAIDAAEVLPVCTGD